MKLTYIANDAALGPAIYQIARLVVEHDLDLLDEADLDLLESYLPVSEGLFGNLAGAAKNLGKSALGSGQSAAGALSRKLDAIAHSNSPWADTIKSLGIPAFIQGIKKGGKKFIQYVNQAAQQGGGSGTWSGGGGSGGGSGGGGSGGGNRHAGKTPQARVTASYADLEKELKKVTNQNVRANWIKQIVGALQKL